jgi:hypothetical protein
LPVSATVCSVSANRAGDPVSAAAIPFASAIVALAANAASTLPRLSSRPGAAEATGASGGGTLMVERDATAGGKTRRPGATNPTGRRRAGMPC